MREVVLKPVLCSQHFRALSLIATPSLPFLLKRSPPSASVSPLALRGIRTTVFLSLKRLSSTLETEAQVIPYATHQTHLERLTPASLGG